MTLKDYITRQMKSYPKDGTQPDYNELIDSGVADLIADKDLLNNATDELAREPVVKAMMRLCPQFIIDKSEAQELNTQGVKNICRYLLSALYYKNGELTHNLPFKYVEVDEGHRHITDQQRIDDKTFGLYHEKSFTEVDEITIPDKTYTAEYIIIRLNIATNYSMFDESQTEPAWYIVNDSLKESTLNTIYDAITESLYRQLIKQGRVCKEHYINRDEFADSRAAFKISNSYGF